MAIQEDMAEEIIPKNKGINSDIEVVEKISLNSTSPAIEIAGIPNKKENLADELLSKPDNSEVVIVIPERETPGIRART